MLCCRSHSVLRLAKCGIELAILQIGPGQQDQRLDAPGFRLPGSIEDRQGFAEFCPCACGRALNQGQTCLGHRHAAQGRVGLGQDIAKLFGAEVQVLFAFRPSADRTKRFGVLK